MPATVRAYPVQVGRPVALDIAKGEDRRYLLTFTEPGQSSPKNFTGLQAAVMTWRDKNGLLIVARSYTPSGSSLASGVLAFDLVQADTVDQAVQAVNVDVFWEDASGFMEQILVASTGRILEAAFQPGEPVTTPPGVAVQWLALTAVAVFPGPDDDTGPLEITVTYPDLGLGVPHIWLSQPQTNDTEQCSVQTVDSSVTSTQATIRANKSFIGKCGVAAYFPAA